MAITNIVDARKRKYRFLKVNAVVEAAWHDNRVKDADQIAKPEDDGPGYSQREHITVADAIAWGNSYVAPVTLFLYDEGCGIYSATASNP